ncbi:hypothetical protein C5O19_03660 [Siphonobacter curvatus]|uniref:Uncharacterized protein n=1 Tax=Siphonobacter curvatus TaxID=2094562 RepID=A0A2S7IM04_9BACT|nr:hypothetical protein BWI97_05290 [Siphonobacter sp. BAB-5405]PQA58771.1 hypothetical protein C5O19_03660 [Siphonobacter curvatus]
MQWCFVNVIRGTLLISGKRSREMNVFFQRKVKICPDEVNNQVKIGNHRKLTRFKRQEISRYTT